jgi:FkbM family methyltransferase
VSDKTIAPMIQSNFQKGVCADSTNQGAAEASPLELQQVKPPRVPMSWRFVLPLLAWYLRTFRFELARWRFVRYVLTRIRLAGASMGKSVVRTWPGFQMELELNDWVDQHIWATGAYEDTTSDAISCLLRPGDCAIDLGANIGYFTLLMSKCVGKTGCIWSFEPAPSVRQRLLRNLKLNKTENVIVREEAVSNADGATLFFSGEQNHSGIGSLRPLSVGAINYQVKTCRLDSCLPQSLIPQLIKIDVEGAEFFAIEGMLSLLGKHHPDLVVEMSGKFLAELGKSSLELFELLQGLGYQMYHLDWDGLVECKQWDQSLPDQFNALYTTRKHLPHNIRLKQSLQVYA